MLKYPDEYLLAVIMSDNTSLPRKAACKAALEFRNRRRDFWSKGIVAWIALIIASASFIWQIAKEVTK